jgi:putative ABC transport system permease protein
MSEARLPGLAHACALAGEVIHSGLTQLWVHKLRSLLTLTLLMLGVFAVVVMSSMLNGTMEMVRAGFAGMGWDGALVLQARRPGTVEEQNRFARSPGLRMEDLSRLTAPCDQVLAFLPRAVQHVEVRTPGGMDRAPVVGIVPGYLPAMNRRIASGRGLTEDDQKRHSPVAVLGTHLAARVLGGADPVGREIVVRGVPFRVVGVLAPLLVFNEAAWEDTSGILVPLECFMDRLEPAHRLDSLTVKLNAARDLAEVSALMLARARQAHHGIEDVAVKNLDAQAARTFRLVLAQMRGWKIVLLSLAGTVLLVGGVGVLSVMLISCSDRRFEIGLRKALGASDREIFGQFLLEAAVLGALGALAGTVAGATLCEALSSRFPQDLKVDPMGLAVAWAVALALAMGFGLYPALRAMRLSPMEAMR